MSMTKRTSVSADPVINGAPIKMYPTDKSKGEVVSVMLNQQGGDHDHIHCSPANLERLRPLHGGHHACTHNANLDANGAR